MVSTWLHRLQDNFRGAAASLELALSHNFEVRNSSVYYVIKVGCHA